MTLTPYPTHICIVVACCSARGVGVYAYFSFQFCRLGQPTADAIRAQSKPLPIMRQYKECVAYVRACARACLRACSKHYFPGFISVETSSSNGSSMVDNAKSCRAKGSVLYIPQFYYKTTH